MAQSHSNTDSAPVKQKYYPKQLIIQPETLRNSGTCPRATTSTCISPDFAHPLLFASTCKTWSCPTCARAKVRRLAWLTNLAKPNRLLTLTVDPSRYADPRSAFVQTAAFVPELIRSLRKRFGAIEYLRVTEVCKSGFPHYHMLVRSDFLPHAVVKSEWNKYTGAQIVDLRQVQDSFSAYWYLVKYLTKLHRKEWTERHVSYSKNFFPCPTRAPQSNSTFDQFERFSVHPFCFLANWYQDCVVEQLSDTAWHLTASPSKEMTPADPTELGLPASTLVPTMDD